MFLEFPENSVEITCIRESLEFLMLPTLKEDLDQVDIQAAHFKDYKATLLTELPRFYDLVQLLQKTLLQSVEHTHQTLRAQIVLLLCELTATNTPYRLDTSHNYLLENAQQLLNKFAAAPNSEVHSKAFKYYEEKLTKNVWKRQLGATHGFVKYLEHRFTKSEEKMSQQLLTFSLAVALNVRECYDSFYKLLGVRIFTLMLMHNRKSELEELNIHSVIYDNIFNDAYKMDTVDTSKAVWNCLYLCLDYFNLFDNFAWNQYDDLLERLIHNVSLSSNSEMSLCLLEFITRLGYHVSINRQEIEEQLITKSIQDEANMFACRELCASISSITSYRWAKNILQMLLLESEKLKLNIDVFELLIRAMHRCYLVCILPIPLHALHTHLEDFYFKIVGAFANCIVLYDKAPLVVNLTLQFVRTFKYQIQSKGLECRPEPTNFTNLRKAFNVLDEYIGSYEQDPTFALL